MAGPAPRRAHTLRLLLFTACSLPFVWVCYLALSGGLGANPIRAATHFTGIWALRFLILALAVTPLARHAGLRALPRYRRTVGLFAFFYASLHMLLYFAVDHFFHWETIVKDIVKRPFITVGMVVFVILLALAVTSTNAMIRRLGARRWRTLHRLVYVAGFGAVLHFLIGTKADIGEPLIYMVIVATLIALRFVPPLPRLVARLRA